MCKSFLVNVICTSGLGISSNYILTLIIRLIHGFADGALNVTKTMIAEISNERNLPLGTSFVFLGAALGRLLGPVLGGYLSHPENFSTLTSHFPILLSVIRSFHTSNAISILSSFHSVFLRSCLCLSLCRCFYSRKKRFPKKK